ncbi:MAG TPA: acireductone synthase [Alphaproteobacteria bacterium]|jgi:enolase-phosphatase E1
MATVTSSIRGVVTDIEGTTSSISFVHEVLFPYAYARMGDFIATHGDEPAVRAALDEARRESGDPALDDAALATHLRRWIDEDRKATPLKTLQGMIWAEGYRAGAFQGHVYDDAVAALRSWHGQGLKLYIYSSGSIAAQKQIFGHTAFGDLTPLFSGYFDTTTGPKKEAESYRKISAAVGVPPDGLLFLSDSTDEIAAARAAGWQTVQLRRPGEAQPAGEGAVAESFAAIHPNEAVT